MSRTSLFGIICLQRLRHFVAVVEATCGDDGGMSQTNDVVVTRALEVAAEMMCCDDGAMS